MKIVDMRCLSCEREITDVDEEEYRNKKCDCGGDLARVFGFRKVSEFEPGFYSNFEHDDIYIETRQQYKDECEKRGLYQRGGKGCYDASFNRKKHHVERLNPPVKRRPKTDPKESVAKALKQLNI